ncbi:hypothetical protein [Clostridium sp. CF012]|uniref:hypothetical protein n=1 Tax=Clostridium sp. CF012 TaxID=2843319 RepID=UPI001C0E7A9F|nr:hypothetical protein [Clostridium sp. CF012]MBU3144607.1 hypothetical protein [Clostridium sp. CF012]
MDKKFLLRMSERKFDLLTNLSKPKSLNQYLNEIIDTHIESIEGRKSKMETVVIDDLKVKDVREAVTATQHKWYMDFLVKYKICFFTTTRMVTPMMNILFYGDSQCDLPNCISHVGKVSHIYRHVVGNEILDLPELQALLSDPNFGKEILSWREYQIVVLSEVKELRNPIPLTADYVNHPRIIVNRTTSLVKAITAKKIDDLFID